MLLSLSIRDVVLIDRLDLDCRDGLTVLTGETGAGKSILLDALGLALGQRADSGLVRTGCAQATVSAAFAAGGNHPARTLLSDQGLGDEPEGDPIVLRRQVGRDGRSRAFINDSPVSARLLRDVADTLLEIEGQFEAQGLLDPHSHRDLLDDFAASQDLRGAVTQAHRAWRTAAAELDRQREGADTEAEERARLAQDIAEIEALGPEAGEAGRLAAERTLLMSTEHIVEGLNEALDMIEGDPATQGAAPGVLDRLRAAQARLDRIADKAGHGLRPALEALERAMIETEEAVTALQAFGGRLEAEPDRLERVDDRLHALRAAARRHGIEPDDLPALAERMQTRMRGFEDRGGRLARLAAEAAAARASFDAACRALSARRRDASAALAQAVMAELPALKLERAVFTVALEPRAESAWGADGAEDVRFMAATNPGQPPGPLHKVASGGELARFMLALKVVLAHGGPVETLIFDEVDSGVGGATAAAVGDRLAALADRLQVLVVTHSPQVAARGDRHWRVLKRDADGTTTTTVETLDGADRLEEVARMLSGARITAEARGAAARLLETAA